MLLPMLEAISDMIKGSKEPEVVCAKIMLDKIIGGMGSASTSLQYIPQEVKVQSPKEKKAPSPKNDEPQYAIDFNQDMSIKAIFQNDGSHLAKDAKVILDGATMTYEQAIGKHFNDIRIL